MPLRDRRFLDLEKSRLTRYQIQHRGLNFVKVWLPPISDKNVNIIGYNNHVYKGKIPRVPMDQLPSEVDPKYIDEEELYKEIRDLKSLNMLLPGPLEPNHRVGGGNQKAKRLTLAPIEILNRKFIRKTPIIGSDAKIYRGSTCSSVPVLEENIKLQESEAPTHSRSHFNDEREFIIPTTVSLLVDGESPAARAFKENLIQMPESEINKIINAIQNKDSSPKISRASEEVVDSSEDIESKENEDLSNKPETDEKSEKPDEDEESYDEQEFESEEKSQSIETGESESKESKETSASESRESEKISEGETYVSDETSGNESTVSDETSEDKSSELQERDNEESV